MPHLKLLVDTNIFVDFLNVREPYYEKARLLMLCGRAGEFELWASASQMTDFVYVLSNGGRASDMPDTLERLRGLRTFVNIYAAGGAEVDGMLATSWADPEDALLFEVALRLKADCIVTRNARDFKSALVPTMNCDELFAWIAQEFGTTYDEVPLHG